MCGIAGFVALAGGQAARQVVERMTSLLHHRGPDDEGFLIEPPHVYLGHRRLSIVDLKCGRQPMSNEDGSLWIIYNGEIFNHAEIRSALERAGHRYRSRSDTETILHAYEEYGPGCLELFRGMYAFVIWDRRNQTLFAARDRVGKKPFYYYWDGRLFAFASEIKALLTHPDIQAKPEPAALPEYLSFGYLSGEQTMFRGIRKLMPGHHMSLRLRDGNLELSRPEQYWDIPEAAGEEAKDEREWISRLRHGLEETVRLRLMADVPLGAFLSGGLDSSLVTALVCRLRPGPVETFSVGYRERAFSELGYAAEVSRYLGTVHREVVIDAEEFFGELPHLIWHEDEPICWPSSVSLYFVSRLASEHVKVVLTGEGGDELFAGYERYRWTLWNLRANNLYQRLPGFLRRRIRNWIESSRLLKADLRRKLGHTFLGREPRLESLYLDNFYGAFSQTELESVLKMSAGGAYENFLHYWNRRDGTALARMLYADQKTYLVELLMKQDQMSMATSIESRVPLLDHHLLALSWCLPDRLKIRGAEQKYALKRAAEGLLPERIIYRKKMGFPTPLRAWLRAPQAGSYLESLMDREAFVAEYLDHAYIRTLAEEHRRGRIDATDRLWRLLNLELWGRIFFRGESGKIEAQPEGFGQTS